MTARFTQSFKIQAVKKALNRSHGTSLREVSEALGVGQSTLRKWMDRSRLQSFESDSTQGLYDTGGTLANKRPQDWSLEARLEMIIHCNELSESEVSQVCREQGLFPHHIKQWKEDFVSGVSSSKRIKNSPEAKQLAQENKLLKKELNRKDKALAETAALLVLKKKVDMIWGDDEEDLS